MKEAMEFLEEARSLRSLLQRMPECFWTQSTPFKGWTPWDVVAHLAMADHWALATMRSREEFGAEMKEVTGALANGTPLTQYTRARFAGQDDARLLHTWSVGFESLCCALERVEPTQRVAWFGPDMNVRTFATARLMETWAHGQDVYDLLQVRREYNDRLRSIALLGVKTFAFTFVNRGLTAPADAPFVSLVAPSGERWDFNQPSATERVEGLASEFCHVVTQNRNVADTQLQVTGDIAQSWMRIAQCFAGPAEDPPPPGHRLGVDRRPG